MMVVETLSGANPNTVINPESGIPTSPAKTVPPPAKAKEKADASEKGAKKGKKLGLHLLVGLIMVVSSMVGYIIYGSRSRTAQDVRQVSVDVSMAGQVGDQNSAPVSSGGSNPGLSQVNLTWDDLARLQSEMNNINQRMNALQSVSLGAQPIGTPNGTDWDASLTALNQKMMELQSQMANSQTAQTGIPGLMMGH